MWGDSIGKRPTGGSLQSGASTGLDGGGGKGDTKGFSDGQLDGLNPGDVRLGLGSGSGGAVQEGTSASPTCIKEEGGGLW
jgi:hypothetical protein